MEALAFANTVEACGGQGEELVFVQYARSERKNVLVIACKSSKDHSKPRNEVDTSLKSPV